MSDTTRPQSSSILIRGTGALATLFAWRLTNAGYDVTMLGSWQLGLRALREKGARLVDAHGNERALPVRVAEHPDECRGIAQAIVLVKSWQTELAARQLRECLAPDGLALTLQNGLGNAETLGSSLGSDRVVLGTTTTGATLLGPGLVKAAGEGPVSVQSHPGLAPLISALKSGGFEVKEVTDATSLLWGKLVINSAINPLTALLRVANGELLNRPAARELMRRLAEETAAVARAEGVKLPFVNPAAMVEEVAQRTGSNYSSMLQDIRRGAPTEIDAICGAVASIGERDGVATPLNEACWQLVSALTQPVEVAPEPQR
ncbi:MAG TPA: 2-dehydropantoate 2-reductase [Anaerolineales bacterium]